MIYFHLYISFFMAGAFAFGGGFAIIPFLNDMINTHHWFTQEDLSAIIALSELTPGAIGVNMATYAGFLASGVDGAIIATLGLITPAIIMICLLGHVWKKIKNYPSVTSVFNAVKASVVGLLFSIFLSMFLPIISTEIISWHNLKIIIIFLLSFIFARIKKIPVFVLIILGAGLGVLFGA